MDGYSLGQFNFSDHHHVADCIIDLCTIKQSQSVKKFRKECSTENCLADHFHYTARLNCHFFYTALGVFLVSIFLVPLATVFFSLITAGFCSLLGRPDIYPPLPESQSDDSDHSGSNSSSTRSSSHTSSGQSSSSSSSGGGRSSGGSSGGGGASGSW